MQLPPDIHCLRILKCVVVWSSVEQCGPFLPKVVPAPRPHHPACVACVRAEV